MAKLLVVPEETFNNLKVDGVLLTKLCDANYIAENVSVSSLASIHDAINEFPFSFCENTDVVLADSPVTGLREAASQMGQVNRTLDDLHNRLEARIASNQLRKGNVAPVNCYVYSLYPVDENLWVAVQKSLCDGNGDPVRLSIKANADLFHAMVGELLRTRTLPCVANTKLFTYYLEAVAANG